MHSKIFALNSLRAVKTNGLFFIKLTKTLPLKINNFREHVHGTDIESDWLSAMIVALDAIKTATDGGKFEALKLVLFR